MKRNWNGRQGFLIFGLFLAISAQAEMEGGMGVPRGPDERTTPGTLCSRPVGRRYPEQIPYCERSVSDKKKNEVFAEYVRLGYDLDPSHRDEFKIDHLIPLCMGGGNEVQNLWPQHFTIYRITDPLEPALCNKMAEGRLRQKEAIDLMIRGKLNLSEVPSLMKYVRSL
jgi:hypothetical protein